MRHYSSTADKPAKIESDASASWRAEYAFNGVGTSIEPDVWGSARDRFAAATRQDRPMRYRRKHARGVSS